MTSAIGAVGPRWVSIVAALAVVALCACGEQAQTDATSRDAAVSPASAVPLVYATVSKNNEVLVIDSASHAVLRSIPVGRGPAIILASPDKRKLYTANWADNTISVIDRTSEQVTSISVSGRPYVIAMSASAGVLYAGLSSNAIAVIDGATDAVAREIKTDELPASIIVSPDGQTLYVATLGMIGLTGAGPGRLQAIAAASGEVLKPAIDVGSAPAWITITPDGATVYTLNFLSDDISVVDTASWRTTTTIATGAGSQAIIGNVTPDGQTLFVTNYGTGELVAIDRQTNAVRLRAPLNGRPVGVNFTPQADRVYTTDFGPESLAMSPLSGLTYLLTGNYTSTAPGFIRAFATATGEPSGEPIQVGPGPTSLVVIAD
jgi:YVTN family beta-propeller protein